MRLPARLLLVLLLTSCSHTSPAGTPGPPSPGPPAARRAVAPPPGAFLASGEPLGALRTGLPADAVIRALGAPASRGPAERWGATGQVHQEWRWPALGITLELVADAETGPQTVRGITITAPCALRTRLGIGIGSPIADVRRGYGPHESPDTPYDGRRFVAGSLFDGVLFFVQQDRVASIFVGSAAE